MGKFREVKALIPDIEQVALDLPEIQELDPQKIINAKLWAPQNVHSGSLIIDDTSLLIEQLGGLPGPLIKWFEQALGLEGIANLAEGSPVTARTLIGYAHQGDVRFYEGALHGTIVHPRGSNGIGWDQIFVPNGLDKTMAQLTLEEKNTISMRKEAVLKLKKSFAYLR